MDGNGVSNRVLTVEELGELRACQHCGAQTFRQAPITALLDSEGVVYARYPKGFSAANRRYTVWMRGMKYTLCQNCRYSPPFERY